MTSLGTAIAVSIFMVNSHFLSRGVGPEPEGVHGLQHGDLGEHDNGEKAGMDFDQKYYSPGPALYGPTDFIVPGIDHIWYNKLGF